MSEPGMKMNRHRIVRRMLAALGLAVAVSAARATAGDEPDVGRRDAPTVRFEALPYAWVPGIHGSLAVENTTVQVDVGTMDVLDLVFDGDALAGAGYFAFSYNRLAVFVDSWGGYAETSVAQTIPTPLCCTLTISARNKMKFALTDVGLGYELLRLSLPARERSMTLDVWAGARTVYLSNELDAEIGVVQGAQRSANVRESFAWADPLIGVRWSVPVLDHVALDFRGDIGGFGASSELTWGLVGDVRVWVPWKPFDLEPFVVLGYRVVALDRSPDVGDLDLQLRGPLLGVGFVFG